ncbi:MAG: DUF6175 family protein [Spirochaetota bacterium]
MKRSVVASFLVLTLACAVSCGGGKKVKDEPKGSANTMHGVATGMAAVYDGDKGLARDRAIEDACKKLVEQVLGNNVSASAMVQDFQLVSSIIESSSTGMVKNQKINKEGVEGGDTYVVTLEGDVYASAVGDAIRSTLENYGRPKFIVLLQETFEGEVHQPGLTASELSIMETMGNQGFQFVDAATVQSLMEKDKADMQKAMKGQVRGNEEVQSLLLDDSGAEVIIFGQVTAVEQKSAQLSQYNKSMKSRMATINLKAVDVYTGDILATVSATAPAMHIDANTASVNAVKACLGTKNVLGKVDDYGEFKAGNFMNQITRKFLESATRRPVQLSIAGLSNKEMIKFREFLTQRVRGVKKVEVKGQQGSEAKLEVLFAGKTVDLTDEFANKGEAAGWDINIVKSYPNRIQLTVKKTN